jgi:hypothetical protein
MKKLLYFVVLGAFLVGCGGDSETHVNTGDTNSNGDVDVTVNGNNARISNGQCYYNNVACVISSECYSITAGYQCGHFTIDLTDNTINYN